MDGIQEKLDVKNMSDLTIKAIKGIYNTENPTKKQIGKYKSYGKDLTLSIIIDCRTPTDIGFMTKLGFNQHDLIMIKEQLVSTKIMKVFCIEKILLQQFVLSHRIDLYFLKHKLAIGVDEKWHKDRYEHEETGRQKVIKRA